MLKSHNSPGTQLIRKVVICAPIGSFTAGVKGIRRTLGNEHLAQSTTERSNMKEGHPVKKRLMLHIFMVTMLVASFGMGILAQAPREKVEITLWHHWTGHRTEWVQEVLDRFMEEHPWIDAQQIVTPSGGTDQLTNFLISGTAPEILMVSSDHAINFISMGGFMSLDKLLAQDGINIGMFNSQDLHSFQLHGSTYALPIMSGSAWTNLMFYNKDMLEAAGFSGNTPPATWSDWLRTAKAMTRVTGDGTIERAGSTIPALHFAHLWNDDKLWTDDWRTVTMSPSRLAETSDFLTQLSNDLFGSYAGYMRWIVSGVNFYNQDYGLWFAGNSAFSNMKDLDFDWGVTLAPVNSLHPNAKPVGLIQNTWAYAIPAELPAEKLEATWALLKWLSVHEDGGGWFSRIQGRPSPVMEFNRHPDYTWENPHWHVVIQAVMHDIATPPIGVNGIFAPVRDQILNETMHPQQGYEQLRVGLERGLAAYWEAVK